MNLVVIICHDLGRHLGCYGARSVRTPRLDAFAATAARFDRAFCCAPQCSPSRAAFWTGRYPHANGVIGLTHGEFANDLHPGEKHLAQLLGDAGYDTLLFGEQHAARSASRLGFGGLHVQKHAMSGGPDAGTCANVSRAFAEFIAQRTSPKPFFAQVSFFEPHFPFQRADIPIGDPATVDVPAHLPDVRSLREWMALYEASIANMDRASGVVLDALHHAGRDGDTLVVFVTDHGMQVPRAKTTLYDPGIEITLLMRLPGMGAGRACPALVSNVDALPTLLELLGQPVPANVQGVSFASVLRGEAARARDMLFAEKTYHGTYDPMRCVRTDRWKFIVNFEMGNWTQVPSSPNEMRMYADVTEALLPRLGRLTHHAFELYDLESDPYEYANLARDPAHRATREQLARTLLEWMRGTGDPLLDGPVAQGIYHERLAQLKAH